MPESEKLLILQRRLTIAALGLFILSILLQLCMMFADVLRIVGISVLISYLFITLVDWLEKYVKNRAVAILTIYILVGVIFFVGLVTVVPYVFYQVNQLLESIFSQLPRELNKLFAYIGPLDAKLHAAQIQVKTMDLVNSLVTNMPRPDMTTIFNRFSDLAMSTATWVAYGLSVLVVSFYYLLEGYGITAHIIEQFPANYHGSLRIVVSEIDKCLQAFFRGQIVLGFGFGAFMLVIYMLLGVPFAFVLGLIVAIWEVVPVIGPALGFIPCFVVVAFNGMDNVHADRFLQVLLITAIFNLAQWLRDNLVAPKYIGNAVGLHPVTIFLAILIGAKIDGVLGIIFSIPVASAVHVIYTHYRHGDHVPVTSPVIQEAAVHSVASPVPVIGDPADPLEEKIESKSPEPKLTSEQA